MKVSQIKSRAELFKYFYKYPHKLGYLLGYKSLNKTHDEWIKYVHLAKKDITLMAHRGAFKTTAITVVGVIWSLFFNPNQRYLIASSTHENAKKILSEIAQHYKNDGLQSLYSMIGGSPINKDRWTKEGITLLTRTRERREGNIEAIGVGGTITSRHYDVIICDDIVVMKDRYSMAERENKKQWIKELQSIIDPSGIIAYIGTPWHKSDIYSITPTAKKYPIGTIRIRGLTKQRINEIRRMQGESFFHSQYKLEHIPEADRIFDSPVIGKCELGLNARIAYLDPAFGGKDFCALTIGATLDGKAYILRGEIWKGTITELYNKVQRICEMNEVRVLHVESNAAQRLMVEEFRRRGMSVNPVNNTKNKYLRIMDNVLKHWPNIVFYDNISDDYMSQVLDYNELAENDDAPDSLAGLLSALRMNNSEHETNQNLIIRGRKRA